MNINRDKIVQLADTDTIENLTSALSQRLIADQLRLTTAESCTGGKLASALCAAEDTPKFYGAGFVTFTDQAKMKILSVSQQSLERYSAVSEKVAAEMATGAIERADADVSIAITGYGGPEGGEDGTPAGTVWFAWHIKGQKLHCGYAFCWRLRNGISFSGEVCPRPAAAITAITRLAWRYLQDSHWWCLYVQATMLKHRHNLRSLTAPLSIQAFQIFAVTSGKDRLAKTQPIFTR